jgi:hypothetical protein
MFYLLLYRLGMYGAVGIDSTAQSLLFAPLAIQEMVLAVWLIARGFLHTPTPGTAERPGRADGRTVAA